MFGSIWTGHGKRGISRLFGRTTKLIGTLAGGSGSFPGGKASNGSAILENTLTHQNYLAFQELKNGMTDPTRFRSYINYMAFDEEYNLIEESSGVVQVGAQAMAWESISTSSPVEINQNGFILVYLSNEEPHDVHYDNVNIIHQNSRILEEQHYYPHGLLTGKSIAMGVNPANGYQFQGNELQKDLGMHLYDFNARHYDQQIGRFVATDPMADYADQEGLSPYQFCFNDPANYTDPLGLFPKNIFGFIFGGHKKDMYKCPPEQGSCSNGGSGWSDFWNAIGTALSFFDIGFGGGTPASTAGSGGSGGSDGSSNSNSGSSSSSSDGGSNSGGGYAGQPISSDALHVSNIISGKYSGRQSSSESPKPHERRVKGGVYMNTASVGSMELKAASNGTSSGGYRLDMNEVTKQMKLEIRSQQLQQMQADIAAFSLISRSPLQIKSLLNNIRNLTLVGGQTAKTGKSFFEGTKYTNKVLGQMKKGDFHGFPESVKAFESSGVITTIKGGDGVTGQMLRIPGEYGGKKGFFEFIKEANGTINHRLFRPNP